jgi:hypothetical protein
MTTTRETEDLLTELMGLADAFYAASPSVDSPLSDAKSPHTVARSTLESALRAVVEDAKRWQEARKHFRVMSARMDGQHAWVFAAPFVLLGNTIDTAIDRARNGEKEGG